MSESYDFPEIDRLTVGAVGPTGRRLFLIQVTLGGQRMTVKVEKQQVAALATFLETSLTELPPVGTPVEAGDLDEPAEPEWPVGTIGVTYDESIDRVLLVLSEAVPGEEDDPDRPEPATARLAATREQVAAFATRGSELVAAGRPPCPLCGYPLDPSGHVCPRTNGSEPPKL